MARAGGNQDLVTKYVRYKNQLQGATKQKNQSENH